MNDIDNIDEKPATSLAEVDIHIRYLRRDLSTLLRSVQGMATKADIDALATRMEGYATKDELNRLAAEVRDGSVQSTFDRWLSIITKLGAAAGVIAGSAAAIAALVHFLDKVPK